MIRTRSVVALAALSLLGASALWSEAADAQCASLTTAGTASTQNFDGLSSVVAAGVAWTDNSTVPGWYSTRTTYNVATGSSNTGALYSFGVAGTNPVTDRALGGIASGTTGTFYWAGCFTNNTGSPLTGVDIAYIGEQWRDGGNATNVAQSLVFQYQVANAGVITDADTPTTGWVNAPTLNFSSPIFNTTAATLDGNAVANRTAKSANLAVPVAVGQEVWIRWQDINDTGNDHGLAIDSVSVTGIAPSISLVKTVGTVSGVCAATPAISVAPGTTVYYCYAVTNTGGVTLNLHDLADNQLGTIFSGLNFALTPGSSVNTVAAGLSIPAVINATTINTATWTAFNAGPVDQVSAQATATVTVVALDADLSITLTDSPDPVTAGTNLTYTAMLSNAGPSDAQGANIALPLPAGTSLVSANATVGGACAGTTTVTCTWTGATAPGVNRTATIVVLVASGHTAGLTATATAASTTPDPGPSVNTATATTVVEVRADLLLGFSASVAQTLVNVPVTFTATSLNQGPSDAQGVSITIALTPDFRYSSHTAAGATCTTPQVGTTGAIVCTWAGPTAPGVTRTLAVIAFSNVEGATGVSASTTSTTTDPVANNNSGNLTVQVGYLVEEIPTLSGYGLILLGLLFGLIGFVAVRRQG